MEDAPTATTSTFGLDLRRRTADQVSNTQVRVSSVSVEGDGAEDEDGEWHFVDDCRRWPNLTQQRTSVP